MLYDLHFTARMRTHIPIACLPTNLASLYIPIPNFDQTPSFGTQTTIPYMQQFGRQTMPTNATIHTWCTLVDFFEEWTKTNASSTTITYYKYSVGTTEQSRIQFRVDNLLGQSDHPVRDEQSWFCEIGPVLDLHRGLQQNPNVMCKYSLEMAMSVFAPSFKGLKRFE